MPIFGAVTRRAEMCGRSSPTGTMTVRSLTGPIIPALRRRQHTMHPPNPHLRRHRRLSLRPLCLRMLMHHILIRIRIHTHILMRMRRTTTLRQASISGRLYFHFGSGSGGTDTSDASRRRCGRSSSSKESASTLDCSISKRHTLAGKLE